MDALEQPDHGTAGYVSGKLESCSKIDDFVVAVDSGLLWSARRISAGPRSKVAETLD